jgi:hypothetical protein
MELLLKEKPLKAQPVAAQAVNVLSQELPALFLALLVICISDGDSFQADPLQKLGVWPTLFELVSAYGPVGLSLGYPGSVLSMSAFLSTFSHFVIIGVMLAGRMRKLPLSIDPAVRVKNIVELELQRQQAEELERQAEAERLRRALGAGGELRSGSNTRRGGHAGDSSGMRRVPPGWVGGGGVRRASVAGPGGARHASAVASPGGGAAPRRASVAGSGGSDKRHARNADGAPSVLSRSGASSGLSSASSASSPSVASGAQSASIALSPSGVGFVSRSGGFGEVESGEAGAAAPGSAQGAGAVAIVAES